MSLSAAAAAAATQWEAGQQQQQQGQQRVTAQRSGEVLHSSSSRCQCSNVLNAWSCRTSARAQPCTGAWSLTAAVLVPALCTADNNYQFGSNDTIGKILTIYCPPCSASFARYIYMFEVCVDALAAQVL
jgi:hypothetical protein